ncbi:uncharacterized protein ACA1_147700 [Acanthamoeba castellanii str. Neff]|uniref:Uncharacterized protein n=1 Tax=Acanthamoeba castellanii (strain ATCC 30010 / Neff) TaxID=1257118 RepID=L8GM14_ACACF|nr:uncharacterized protein ACA1_147700 [Acanthamoeba castellanii str. Neff]ELR13261.1 hypothetical protein ACA1_147700 [Acanthamoeba castellanii str. Neff]
MKLPARLRLLRRRSAKVTTLDVAADGEDYAAKQRAVALAKWELALFEERLGIAPSYTPEMEPRRKYSLQLINLDGARDDEEDVELLPPCSPGFKRLYSDEVERRRIVQVMASWQVSTTDRNGPQRES